MFIKQAYERRLKRDMQKREGSHEHKPKIQQIGSIHNEKLNYARDQQFFSKEDVPEKVRSKKVEVIEFIDPDHLGLRRKEWNSSVSVPKYPHLEETHERKLIKIKLGLLDHPVPAYKPPVIYQGTQIRNDFSGWQVSTEINRRAVVDQLDKLTKTSISKNKLAQKTLLTNYIPPRLHVDNLNETRRKEKMEEKALREQIRQQFVHKEPAASKERTDAAVFRLVYEEKKLGLQKRGDDVECKYKPDLTSTLKPTFTFRKVHDGVWGSTKDGMAWSCCQSEQEDGEGCVLKKRDKQRWNLTSFTS